MEKKIRVLSCVAALNPCAWVGIFSAMEYLEKFYNISHVGVECKDVTWPDLIGADVIIFQRNTECFDLKILRIAKLLKKKIIYDIDDFLLGLPERYGELANYHNAPHRISNIKKFLNLADIVKAGSPQLAQNLSKYTSVKLKVFPLPNAQEYFLPVKHSSDGIVRIAIILTQDFVEFINLIFLPALKYLARRYRNNAQFIIFGKSSDISFCETNMIFVPFMDYQEYIKYFSNMTCDIGVAYLKDDFFTRCKTNNKFREFSARGVAGVYSKMPVYSDCVQHGETGLLADNTPEAFSEAISWLIENREDTRRIGLAARKFAEVNYRLENYARAWYAEIKEVDNVRVFNKMYLFRYFLAYFIFKIRRLSFSFPSVCNLFCKFYKICQEHGLLAALLKTSKYFAIKFKIYRN